ncbi:radical SAM/SPASM domain-containing protein [Allorhizocola rhizosphaerae]|uniref:radical SAM/SPASM domain-containing protein n=1 Tax=Allorhizocola rhizosphaerae TaxID=1872709 RepID=UPI000E3CA842|nr:radical SAM protein [Allorhizocola rhizosphaerae]
MIRSRYLLLSDAFYRDRSGRVARLAYSARRATLFAVDPGTASALDDGDLTRVAPHQLATLAELEAVVPDGEDELREVLASLRAGSDDAGVRVFTLMPTSWCNMACSYCGQEHERTKARMDAVAARVEAALADPAVRRVHVNWFGGEPLLALRTIRALSARFVRAGKPYMARMATNGSLLTPSTLRVLHDECAVQALEVTIDGPPALHDLRRLKRNGRGSFERIVGALQSIPDGMVVTIRINVDHGNAPHVEELIGLLAARGLARPGIELHPVPVHSWGNDVSKVELGAREYASLEAQWLRYAGSLGFGFATLPSRVKRTTCVATSVHSEVLDPQGRVYSCSEHPLVPGVRSTGVVATVSSLVGATPRPRGAFDDWYEDVEAGAQRCGQCPLLPVCGGACPKLWREGHAPCPSYKFNLPDRFDLAAARLGWVRLPSG